jgi:hypothetical protein
VVAKWTHKACFDHFGTIPSNPRWSWSGRSSDGKVVSVTFWQDKFEEGGRVYRGRWGPNETTHKTQAGRAELLCNLKWARDHCDGILRIIVAMRKTRRVNLDQYVNAFRNARHPQ